MRSQKEEDIVGLPSSEGGPDKDDPQKIQVREYKDGEGSKEDMSLGSSREDLNNGSTGVTDREPNGLTDLEPHRPFRRGSSGEPYCKSLLRT